MALICFHFSLPVSLDPRSYHDLITDGHLSLQTLVKSRGQAKYFHHPNLSIDAATLRWIKLQSTELSDAEDSWQGLLTDVRNDPNFNIEKFQLSGVTKSSTEVWFLWPIYDEAWKARPGDEKFLEGYNNDGTNKTTKLIEAFVMGEEVWPTEKMRHSNMPALR